MSTDVLELGGTVALLEGCSSCVGGARRTSVRRAVAFDGLGDVVTEQAPSQSVKSLQNTLVSISNLAASRVAFRKGTAAKDYNPYVGKRGDDVPGRVGFYTTSALAALIMDGLISISSIPGAGDFLNNLLEDAGLSITAVQKSCWRDRIRDGSWHSVDGCNMENVWDGWKEADPETLKELVIDPIRNNANMISLVLKRVVLPKLQGSAVICPAGFVPLGTTGKCVRAGLAVAGPSKAVRTKNTRPGAGSGGAKKPMSTGVKVAVGVGVGAGALLLVSRLLGR